MMQQLDFANFERAEISILLPFDSLGLEGKMFFTIVMGNEMLTGLGWIWDDLCVCVCVCVLPRSVRVATNW